MKKLNWGSFWVEVRFKSLVLMRHLSRTSKGTQRWRGRGPFQAVVPGLVEGCLSYPGLSSRVIRRGAQGHSVWGRFAGKSYHVREASWLGGFGEQGGFQHVEMEVAFWAGEKSVRKTQRSRSTEWLVVPLGWDLVIESPSLRELYWGKA